MESNTKHIIPIFGLKENFDNQIKLVMGENEKVYSMPTKASNLEYPLTVNYRSEVLNNEEIYFTVASYSTYLSGWDSFGNLRFYLTKIKRIHTVFINYNYLLCKC